MPLPLDSKSSTPIALLSIAVSQTIHPALHFDHIEGKYETRSYAHIAQSIDRGQAARNSRWKPGVQ